MHIEASLFPRQFFQPSCPSGGTFYACNTGTNFVGCCTSSSACASGCSDGSIEPASFNPSFSGQFQDQECPSGSRWYTCAATTPPFMGCCKSNPCSSGACPMGDLTSGFLSSNPKVAADFAGANGFSTVVSSVNSATTTSPISSASTSTLSSSTTTTPAALSTLPSPANNPSTSIGIIVGASVAGVLFLLLLSALLVLLLRYRRRSKHTVSPPCPTLDIQNTKASASTALLYDPSLAKTTPAPQYEPNLSPVPTHPLPSTPSPHYHYSPDDDFVSSTSPPLPLPSPRNQQQQQQSPPPPLQLPHPPPTQEMDAEEQVAFAGPYEMGTGATAAADDTTSTDIIEKTVDAGEGIGVAVAVE